MAPPSPLAIATKAVERLVKERDSYKRELKEQGESIEKLEKELSEGKADEDGNGQYMLNQQRQAKEETKAVFGPLRKRIDTAVQTLQSAKKDAEGSEAKEEELKNAQDALDKAQKALEEED